MQMIILVCSKISQASIHASLGKPEYSYYFLLKEFLPALERVAQVVVLDSITDVDRLYHQHTEAGETVVFLSVSPPSDANRPGLSDGMPVCLGVRLFTRPALGR